MSAFDSILSVFKDPPPEFVFEIAADGIAMARTRQAGAIQETLLAPGVLCPSPAKENVLNAEAFAEAVRRLVPAGKRGRKAALILPDHTVRISVLDFDSLPEKEEERRSLLNFRLRKSVPFDVDEAALSYFPQDGKKVLVALAPMETVAHYEAPFRAAGLHTGLVTVSSLALLDLMPPAGSLVVARRSPGVLTVVAVSAGVVTIARSLELPDDAADPLEEISSDIYSTLAFIEDQSGAKPERLFLAGFGEDAEVAATRLSVELELPAVAIEDEWPGLAGYLKSLIRVAGRAAA
jgi:type IV pilus assembly protein PilM